MNTVDSLDITDINQLDLDKKYSYADYLKWKFDEYVELIRGKVFKKMSPAPMLLHQGVIMSLTRDLSNFLKNKSCKVYPSPVDVRFPKKELDNDKIYTVVQPDIIVVCDKTKLDKKGCMGAPDMVVEVVSSSSKVLDWNFKYNLYQEFGVKEYWIVEPTDKTVNTFILNEENKYLQTGMYEEEAIIPVTVLPGLSINWIDIFED